MTRTREREELAGNLTRVRVLVADDHPLYREALVDAISRRPELDVVGEARDWSETTTEVLRLKPDVALLDLKMPGPDGPSLLKAIDKAGIHTRTLFLSGFGEANLIYSVVAAGARGFLGKEAGGDTICDSILTVARGESVLSPRFQSRVLDAIRTQEKRRHQVLTPREREILQLVSQGHSNAAIAKRLMVSPETIKSHLRNIYAKLEVRDRSAAVAEGIRRGLID